MAIEFRCTQCNRLLRTDDDSVGMPARCPDCGTVQTVPARETEVPPPPPPPPETPNPFQSPGDYGPAPGMPAEALRPYALQRVAGPATALIVIAAIGLVFNVLGAMGGMGRLAPMRGPGVQVPPRVMIPANLVAVAVAAVVILGAIKMKNLESYGLSMTAAILALIPCTSPCCVLGLPFGIWALVALTDPPVRAAFRS